MKHISRMDIGEFREDGYLQEVNLLFFHPLGLALEVIVDKETGTEVLGGIWDCRHDPEGMIYKDLAVDDAKKANRIERLRKALAESRVRELGYAIQPVPEG